MSAKPVRNKETHYNKAEQQGSEGKKEGSGRKRQALSPERAKDKAKRSYKEGGAPVRAGKRSFEDERPVRRRAADGEERTYKKRDQSADDRPARPRREAGSDRPAEQRERKSYERKERTDDKKPYSGRKERTDDRPSFEKNDRKPYSGRTERADEDRPKRASRNDRPSFDREERRPYARKDDGDKKSYRERSADPDKKPFERRPKADGDRPFKKRGSFEDRKDRRTEESGEKRFGTKGRRDDKPYEKRDSRGGKFEEKKGKPRAKKPFDGEDFYEDERPFTRSTKWDEKAKAGPMTLNKYLAHSGISSRRDAAEIIKAGKVKVNGEVKLEPGYRVQEGDQITCDDKVMKPQKHHVYILLNKPKDYITTTDDEKGRKKVMDLVANAGVDRLYPIGRLDRNTTGVLLITNDGDLAQKLSHPSYNARKIYQVTLDRNLTKRDFDKIIEGVKLDDGVAPVDALAYLEKKNELGIEIHSGRNRIVRRIFEGLGYTVEKLDRVVYAGLTKKNVSRGKWRFLTEKEIIRLKHFKS